MAKEISTIVTLKKIQMVCSLFHNNQNIQKSNHAIIVDFINLYGCSTAQ